MLEAGWRATNIVRLKYLRMRKEWKVQWNWMYESSGLRFIHVSSFAWEMENVKSLPESIVIPYM